MTELKRSILEPDRYEYLDPEESKIYQSVLNSTEEKDLLIKKLLEDKADASRASHNSCKY